MIFRSVLLYLGIALAFLPDSVTLLAQLPPSPISYASTRASFSTIGMSPGQPSLPIPQVNADYLVVQLSSESAEQPDWNNRVSVFIRNHSDGPTVVGIERGP